MMNDELIEFYNKYPYPDIKKYMSPDINLRNLYDTTLPPSPEIDGKKICIAGCGTFQTFLIAQHLKKSIVVGVDISETSLTISKNLCKEYDVNNVVFIKSHFEDIIDSFDIVLATGVFHHTRDIPAFLNNAYKILNPGGVFRGFVYNIEGRQTIRELSNYFISNEFDVSDVRRYFELHKNDFYDLQNKQDEEIADTWLNPRFKEYSVETLNEEFNNTLWKNCTLETDVRNDKKKLYFNIKK